MIIARVLLCSEKIMLSSFLQFLSTTFNLLYAESDFEIRELKKNLFLYFGLINLKFFLLTIKLDLKFELINKIL